MGHERISVSKGGEKGRYRLKGKRRESGLMAISATEEGKREDAKEKNQTGREKVI